MKQFKIFVSSVQKEFTEERKAVKQFIESDKLLNRYFEVFLFEDLPAMSKAAERTYIKKASESDVLILFIGKEYGNVSADGLSPTEKEFLQAVEKQSCVLAYIKNATDSKRDVRVINLINRIKDPKNGFIYKPFKNLTELEDGIYSSLIEFLTDKGVIRNSPFDVSICDGTTYNDINEDLVIDFLENRAIKQKVEVPKISTKDFLVKTIKVVKDEDGSLKPTHAAILFFCDNPRNLSLKVALKWHVSAAM